MIGILLGNLDERTQCCSFRLCIEAETQIRSDLLD